MKIIHFCAGLEFWNGMANTARQFRSEEIAAGYDSIVTNDLVEIRTGIDVVHIHGAWLPILWKVAKKAKRVNAKLIIRSAGSYDPVRLGYHGWKKKLVAFFERRMLRRADVLLATCEAEAKWIKDYVGNDCPKVEITDLRRFFKLGDSRQSLVVSGEGNLEPCRGVEGESLAVSGRELGVREGGLGVRSQESGVSKQGDNSKLNVLYLGRRHPLKGVEYLEAAVRQLQNSTRSTRSTRLNIELRIVSDAKGEELEKIWAWCDVLVLPTLSENFGRVVAEALERGKRVITTDGAPVWGEESDGVMEWVSGGVECRYGGRLLYLKGYRDGSDEERIRLLNEAIRQCVGC